MADCIGECDGCGTDGELHFDPDWVCGEYAYCATCLAQRTPTESPKGENNDRPQADRQGAEGLEP